MKINLLLISAMAMALFLIASCTKPLEEILVKKGGKWNLETYHHKERILDSVLIDTMVYNFGNITFTEDGKSIFIIGNASFGIDTMIFDWKVESDIVATVDTANHDTINWHVDQSSAREQQWSTTRNDSFGGGLRITDENIGLKRAK